MTYGKGRGAEEPVLDFQACIEPSLFTLARLGAKRSLATLGD